MIGHLGNILETVTRNTDEFVASIPKSDRKRYGQFFTNIATAKFMADLFDFDMDKSELCILDAGAGTGILSTAVIDKLIGNGYKGRICITCYETDESVLPLLRRNLDEVSNLYDNVECRIIEKNYITSQCFEDSIFPANDEVYDYVIGNPPYLKIPKDAQEAIAMPSVCYGAPNLYFLFWAMGIHNLRDGQELVYIVPRSWTSGAYFKRFRQYLFDNCVITDIHLFGSRDRIFDNDQVLQETVVVKVKKTKVKPEYISMTSSSTSEFKDIKKFCAPYDTVVAPNGFVYLVTDEEEAEVLRQINGFKMTLNKINLKMQTGLIVDFRTKDALREKLEDGAYPLLYSQHIREGMVNWPVGKGSEVIKTNNKGLLQENNDYLMIKRFTSKEESRRLQCGIFLKRKYRQFAYISTQNKINFIKCDSTCVVYGLYVLLNSSLYDNYYRILNGSTQVNSSEMNQIPVPERNVIEDMGRELMTGDLTVSNCNRILEKWIN